MATEQKQRITRYEARLIAEELYKLMQRDTKPQAEELLRVPEAAAYLRISTSTLYKKLETIPHTKVGKTIYFTKQGLSDYAQRL